jgi:hypothetical protein
MTKLATVTVGVGGSSAINFTNIPQTYTDLVIKVSARSTDGDWQGMYMRLNSATTNYTSRYLDGTGSAASSGVITTTGLYVSTINGTNSTSSTFTNSEINILNYTSNNNKSISTDGSAENNATAAYLNLIANLFSNTAAVNSISLYSAAGNIAQHSTATLYGVKAARTAVGNSIKAVGGNISFDGTYVVHTFNTSGTFTPSDSLRVDYLVVAGGGGGGRTGGGGGAGGLRSTVTATGGGGSLESALSLTAGTSYTVTVGAGGAGTTSAAAGVSGSNSVFSTITSTGGGGSGVGDTSGGQTGGSGGGGGYNLQPGGARTSSPVQGYAGGAGSSGNSSSNTQAGGGGGAGAVGAAGTTSPNKGGDGGNGVAVSISGSSVTYAGGGGGGSWNGTDSAGGTGGGGIGRGSSAAAGNGTTNTGSGGGDAGYTSSFGTSGNGGSGIVIVRYRAVV